MKSDLKELYFKTKKRIYKVKITNEKYERKMHIYAKGKGKYADIGFRTNYGNESIREDFELEEAKEVLKYLSEAIEDLERRMKMPEDE